jgi:membrane associated rhomboid family serine protease
MSLTISIAAVTVLISFLAFSNHSLIDKLIFQPYRIWRYNEWHRLVSCSFIHADMGHLLFNMLAFWSFGTYVEQYFAALFPFGTSLYVIMYFGAVALADVYHLFTQKDNYEYRSLGASGGVAAVVFASIPAYIFGPIYLLYSAYMAKRGGDNVGHIAHFTGSVIGFVFPLLLQPSLFGRFIEQVFH